MTENARWKNLKRTGARRFDEKGVCPEYLLELACGTNNAAALLQRDAAKHAVERRVPIHEITLAMIDIQLR